MDIQNTFITLTDAFANYSKWPTAEFCIAYIRNSNNRHNALRDVINAAAAVGISRDIITMRIRDYLKMGSLTDRWFTKGTLTMNDIDKLTALVTILVDSTTYDDGHKTYLYDQIMQSIAPDSTQTFATLSMITELLTREQ
tara:strand:+ start:78 stop:497 length:420 start_codon:yes stop_codon:yes gene_type:complete